MLVIELPKISRIWICCCLIKSVWLKIWLDALVAWKGPVNFKFHAGWSAWAIWGETPVVSIIRSFLLDCLYFSMMMLEITYVNYGCSCVVGPEWGKGIGSFTIQYTYSHSILLLVHFLRSQLYLALSSSKTILFYSSLENKSLVFCWSWVENLGIYFSISFTHSSCCLTSLV